METSSVVPSEPVVGSRSCGPDRLGRRDRDRRRATTASADGHRGRGTPDSWVQRIQAFPSYMDDSEADSDDTGGNGVVVPKADTASDSISKDSGVLVFSVPLSTYNRNAGEGLEHPPDCAESHEGSSTEEPPAPAWLAPKTTARPWSARLLWPMSFPSLPKGTAFSRSARHRMSRERAVRGVAHGLVVLMLGAADMIYAVERGEEIDTDTALCLGVALAALYGCIAVWLVASCAMPARWEASGSCMPTVWFVLALAHTSMAFVRAWWREALRFQPGEPGAHAAALAGLLQLVLAVLYPSNVPAATLLAVLSIGALIAIEVPSGTGTVAIVDNALLLTSAGLTCVVAASSRFLGARLNSDHSELHEIFSPLVEDHASMEQVTGVSTHVGQLTSRLKNAKERSAGSSIDDKLKVLFDNVFAFLLEEMTDITSLERMSIRDLDDLPPMTAEYVQKTLGQGQDPRLMLQTAGENNACALLLQPPHVPYEEGKEVTKRKSKNSMTVASFEDEHGSVDMRRNSAARSTPGREGSALSVLQEVTWRSRDSKKPQPAAPVVEHQEPTPQLRSQPSPPVDMPVDLRTSTFDENIKSMMQSLLVKSEREEGIAPKLSDDLQKALHKELGLWRFDIFKLSSLAGNCPLAVVGGVALSHVIHRLNIEGARVRKFLDSIEARYKSNWYHNSMHGADVMNNMLCFLRQQNTALFNLEPIERLAALTAAAAHDVGHDGFANNYQVTAETPLARLYNDQSPLENMHCTITFSVLHSNGCDILADLEAPLRATFRGYVTQMILETDLAKHIQTLSRFRQELLRGGFDASHPHTFAQRKELAAFALKCSDVAHSTKPFDLHVMWTLSINAEFFNQGDTERQLGLPCSPFCDRTGTHVAESQRGFYDFIVTPLYKAMDEHLSSKWFQQEVMPQLERNHAFWKRYDGSQFNYNDPVSNAPMLRGHFRNWYVADKPVSPTTPTGSPARVVAKIDRRQSWTAGSLITPKHTSSGRSNTPDHLGTSSNREMTRSHSSQPVRRRTEEGLRMALSLSHGRKIHNDNRPMTSLKDLALDTPKATPSRADPSPASLPPRPRRASASSVDSANSSTKGFGEES